MGPQRRNRAERSVTLSRGATQTVYVNGEDGKPKAVQITTGDTDGTQTEVISGGLKPGMEVITGQLAGENDQASSKKGGGGQRRNAGGGGG
jgi:HlyD family secretion protein